MSSQDAADNEPTVDVGGSGLTVQDVVDVAARARRVRLSVGALDRAGASQRFAEQTARTRPLYGRSTGVGANRTVRITGDPAEHALMLLRSHATSSGARRSPARVRAMLLIRLNQLAAGGSGVRPAVLTGLHQMLEADALPDIGELGSIGTGDLAALATTALALLGEVPTARPLPSPTPFGEADGLAFISSNAGALGDAALAVASWRETAVASLAVAALTFHAVGGNAEAYAAAVAAVTPFRGALECCFALRALVGAERDGTRHDADGVLLAPARIQDPFGLRTIPQVLGPVLDTVAAATTTVTKLINAPTENPLVLAQGGQGGGAVAHHGGFHYTYLQTALDSAALACAQSGPLVLGRLALLIDPQFTGLPPFLGDGTPAASGVMVCEYVAASALGAIRAAAMPAGLQTVTISRAVEEDASFASLAATQALMVAERYRQLVACELVAAVRAVRMQPHRRPAGLIAAIVGGCDSLPSATADRSLTADLHLAADLLPALAALVPIEPSETLWSAS